MTKVVILGTTGMLGSMLLDVFSDSSTIAIKGTRRNELDVQSADVASIERVLKGCDYAINCIGIIKPYIHDDNSFEVQRAIEVNGLFPHRLAQAAKNTGTKIVQIATDCVYDGVRGSYIETDKHYATDVYGKTKSLGEVCEDNFLNLRCSIIGKELKGKTSLLEWFLNQPENASVNGFLNHQWNGVTTLAFAKICLGIVQNDAFFNGLQHIVPTDTMNKSDMLQDFAQVFDRQDIQITPIEVEEAIDRTLLTMNKECNEKLWQLGGYDKIPTIKEMVVEIR